MEATTYPTKTSLYNFEAVFIKPFSAVVTYIYAADE
jgi:hypothetical protein